VKDVELRLVSELMKNSRRSDRELAKVLGVSQPTVSRTIKRLEKEGILQGYTAIPHMARLGIELIAITFANWTRQRQETRATTAARAKEILEKHPNIIFASTGRGIGFDRVTVSLHKDYPEYAGFMRELKEKWGDIMTISESFLISYVSDNVLRPISLQHIAKYLARKDSTMK
jgi:DNA-binding Lrp family transcriptional regulator